MRDASVPLAALFFVGVACGVYVIVRGVERPNAARRHPRVDAFGREVAVGTISLTASVVAAACTTVGFVGYLGIRVLGLSATLSTVIGLGVAAFTVPLAVRMVRAWAVRAAAEGSVDPRYVIPLASLLARETPPAQTSAAEKPAMAPTITPGQ